MRCFSCFTSLTSALLLLILPNLVWSSTPTDHLTYKVQDIPIFVEARFTQDGKVAADGKTLITVYAPINLVEKSEASQLGQVRPDGMVPLIDIEFETRSESETRPAVLPRPIKQSLDPYLAERSYSAEGPASQTLTSASLAQGLLVFSVPENETHDRLVIINIKSLLKNPRTPAQEFLVSRVLKNHIRYYSFRSIDVDARWGQGIARQATLISVADIEQSTGHMRTIGSGVLVHQLYFEIDRAFIDFSESKNSLKLHRSTQNGIVNKENGKMVYPIKQAHSVPHFLPDMHHSEGRIDPSVVMRGLIHPAIISTVSKQGSNGILSLPYLSLTTQSPAPVKELFEKFDSELKAEIIISQAEALPRETQSTKRSISEIMEAILAQSEVAKESVETRKTRRMTQDRGLRLLARLAPYSPYAVEALNSIAASELADSTLKSLTRQTINSLPGDLRGKKKSLVAAQEFIASLTTSVRCGASFQKTN